MGTATSMARGRIALTAACSVAASVDRDVAQQSEARLRTWALKAQSSIERQRCTLARYDGGRS